MRMRAIFVWLSFLAHGCGGDGAAVPAEGTHELLFQACPAPPSAPADLPDPWSSLSAPLRLVSAKDVLDHSTTCLQTATIGVP
jgi:hypothetical protein